MLPGRPQSRWGWRLKEQLQDGDGLQQESQGAIGVYEEEVHFSLGVGVRQSGKVSQR